LALVSFYLGVVYWIEIKSGDKEIEYH